MNHRKDFYDRSAKGKRKIFVSLLLVNVLIVLLYRSPFIVYSEEISPATETEPSTEEEPDDPPAPGPVVPAYPAKVSASGKSNSVKISWSAVEGAQKYRIYRSTSNIQLGQNAEIMIAEVDAGTTSYQDEKVTAGIIYEYYVCAVNKQGESVRDPYLRGAFAWSGNVVPGVYAVKVSSLTTTGFTLSGMTVSSNGLASVRIPVWTEKNGQDDLIWYDAAVSGDSFSLKVKISSHNNEAGVYNCHIYPKDKKDQEGDSYALRVPVPDGKAYLSNPCITAMHAGSYELALTYEAPAGISSVKVATYTKKEGPSEYHLSKATIDSDNRIIRVTINAKDHGNYFGNYYTTVYLTDKKGNQDSHTFTVKYSGKEEILNQVTSINCLQGDATLVESNGKFMLIDAGTLEAAGARVVQVLKEHQAKNLTVILTHPHSDHIEGLRAVADKISIKEVYLQDVVSDYWFDNFIREQLVSLLKSKNIPVYGTPAPGTVFTVGKLTASIIGPQRYYRLGESGATNNNSLYVRIEGYGKRALIAGDSEKTAEKDMLAAGVDLKADVLKVSHHGSSTSSSSSFVKAVSPRIAMISSNIAPSSTVVQRFEDAGSKVYQTRTSGSISWTFLENGTEMVMKHGSKDKDSSLKPALITYGDINNDGKWDVIDVSYMYSHILNKKKLTGSKFEAADINGDKKVDVIDVSYLYSYILKKSKTVPQR